MNKERYTRMTDRMRALTQRLPGGASALRVPTLVCAAIYLGTLCTLMLNADARLIRALVVPAVCFGVVTVLRPLINRQRPYDAFGMPPVGSYRAGKGKSMPSRHAASAAAIAFAVIYLHPTPLCVAAMGALTLLIAALRVLSGQHYLSDVCAALALSAVISWIGYTLW